MPATKVRHALALYLYTRLYATKGARRDVFDTEGDFVEVVCDNEAALWEEAQQLACEFVVEHMRPDYRAIPKIETEPFPVAEHGLGVIEGEEWD